MNFGKRALIKRRINVFDRKKSIVFTPCRIGQLEIKNRLVRSSTFEQAATEKGEVSDALIGLHCNLAKGGVGLILTGIAWVYTKMAAPPMIMRADNDSFIAGMKRLTSSIHKAVTDCKIILQLHHPGRQVISNLSDHERLSSVYPPAYKTYALKHPDIAGDTHAPHYIEATAPSAIYDALFQRTPRALELEEIEKIIDDYADGIRRAKESGFDGAQLNAAHGWLLSSFMSPVTNQRDDIYGGSTENRTRIVREIIRRARKCVGDDFPILIKFNTTDFLPGGIDIDEAIRIGKILIDAGFDALEASGGMWESVTRSQQELKWIPVILPESRTGIKTSDQEAYFLPAAKALKDNTQAKIISVGGYKTFSVIESAIACGATDFISLSRPLVRQPDLPMLWNIGGTDKAECVSCNACLPIGTSIVACRAY
jgi:2,4-dienoyl-CoA reductase-like NADH-dependent reductase (Old Yellow Enzyme family)